MQAQGYQKSTQNRYKITAEAEVEESIEKYLKNNEKEHFFEEIEKSLWGYFADKFNVEIAKLSKESINIYFNEFNIKEVTKEQFIALLDNCEIARYAPSQVRNTKMEELLKEASYIIIDVESQKKCKKFHQCSDCYL